jgi:hypothetical protein
LIKSLPYGPDLFQLADQLARLSLGREGARLKPPARLPLVRVLDGPYDTRLFVVRGRIASSSGTARIMLEGEAVEHPHLPRTGRLMSYVAEERWVDGDVFDCSGHRSDAEFVLLEKLAQPVAVDEVDRRCAVAGGFFLGVGSE